MPDQPDGDDSLHWPWNLGPIRGHPSQRGPIRGGAQRVFVTRPELPIGRLGWPPIGQ
jgi:hypothetical protein